MKKLLIFRHEAWIESARLTELLVQIDLPFQIIKIDQGESVPESIADDVAGLVFLGGTMSANDSLPWIEKELNLIQLAYKNNFPVLGHCLGSQLISKALGGKVTLMPEKEIGWHIIKHNKNPVAQEWLGELPDNMRIMLWHHDEFSIPPGATSLYTTKYCDNQAFVVDNIVATVAHIELSEAMLQEWLDIYGYDINANGESVQSVDEIKKDIKNKMQIMHTLSDFFYLKWLSLAYPNADKIHSLLPPTTKNERNIKGSCLCKAIRFWVKNPREVVNCHCSECRKFHGNYAAYTKATKNDIYIIGKNNLTWYQTSEKHARRGSCKTCGSSLFWEPVNSDSMCIAAGAVDVPSQLSTIKNIYVKNAGDYYVIDDSIEMYNGTMKDTQPIGDNRRETL